MRRLILTIAALVSACCAQAQPLLVQKPAVSQTRIAFSYGGDLWVVGRDGGEAQRLTAGMGVETDPQFSPDGSLIAFTGEYDGNRDVYVVPAAGGEPRRLTYHPDPDTVVGWTPDGKRILFRSTRSSYSSRFARLFTVAVEGGGLPEELPLPMAEEGAYSPDGKRIAYVPLPHAFDAWKRYRGGRTTAIWIADLADSRIEKIPRENSNDFGPMWVKDRIYFLSDRNGPVTLFCYDLKTKKVAPAVPAGGLDLKSASAGPDAIVYEQFGSLHLYDLRSGHEHAVEVRVAADLPQTRPTFEKVGRYIESFGLSPSGARAVFGARGEVLTVPAEKGDARNLTNTPGVAERYPEWSPDGGRIAYFSDESGEYALHIRAQNGMGEVTKFKLPPSFYRAPVWSPDSKKVAFLDQGERLWYIDLEKRQPVKVDADVYKMPGGGLDPAWAPDSRWIAYTKILKNHMRAVFAYSLETGKAAQITDGMSDARYAVFDKNGERLYFVASTDVGPTTGWLDMSSMNRPVTRSVYVAVLRKDLASPLAPESDEEKAEEKKPDAKDKEKDKDKKEPAPVRIDFEGIAQRILALPIPARDYGGLRAGKTGTLYLLEDPPVVPRGQPPEETVQKFDIKTRKTEKLLDGVRAFDISFDGEKMLYRKGEQWFIAKADAAPKSGDGRLKIDEMSIRIDPRAEWKQMYNEVWRIERDFFYDPGLHGVDLATYKARYEPYLERLGTRPELNYLFMEMLGELSVGHLYVRGGAQPEGKRVPGGLLGADYKIENGRYRFVKVYDGENWNPELRAPLTQPGVNVVAGEYLLAVNGRELGASDEVYSFFEETAGKSVVLKVGPDPGGGKSREVTVVPVESESGLRNLAWIEENRRKVDKLSGGKLAYVYLPNTAEAGFTSFNRYFFAQEDKAGAVIDERFNGGGAAADYIIDYLRRPLMNYFMTRDGEPFTTPTGSIFGPKVMIVNEFAGSGGDLMPWMFRKARIGKLVGKRTWGGLVGIFDFPPLIDGGTVTAPNLAFYNTEGAWDVENHGVAPDVEVEFDPQAWRAGHDPQLERAVEIALAELERNPPPVGKRPPFPNYHKK
jgi:tricorn protease